MREGAKGRRLLREGVVKPAFKDKSWAFALLVQLVPQKLA